LWGRHGTKGDRPTDQQTDLDMAQSRSLAPSLISLSTTDHGVIFNSSGIFRSGRPKALPLVAEDNKAIYRTI
jgi:hypothetical protein